MTAADATARVREYYRALDEGDLIVRFVDVFAVVDDGFERLDTYTR